MGTHRRRQTILAMLAEAGDVHVDALANALCVSPNTIRNDLDALGRAGLLRRVRGGAAPLGAADVSGNGASVAPGLGLIGPDAYAARLGSQQAEKELIGAWAAGLVHDGDALVLDASTTVFRMAAHLLDRKNLTVVTNGLNVALLLAQTPSNKVILAASEVRPGGHSVVGRLYPDLLKHFYASKCFVSCTGFSLEQGLTELNVDEAIPKQQMMALAREVFALIDHTKFGSVSSYRFAEPAQIHHLVVDDGIDREMLAAVRTGAEFAVTVVGAKGARTVEPLLAEKKERRYRIGFGNLTEKMLFAQQVRRSLERALRNFDGIELLVRNNDLDPAISLANVEWFIDADIDLMIEYQADAQAGNVIMDRFNRAGIPVIAVDIPLPGATFFGADNYRAGTMAGEALGRWIAEHWHGHLDLLLRLESARVGPPGARIQGQQDGLESVIGALAAGQVRALDFPVLVDEAERTMQAILPELSRAARIAIVAINDEVVLGALAAFEAAGRLDQVVAVGQNGDRLGRVALRREGFPFIGSTAYGPEKYGEQLLTLALRILRGEPTPPAVYCQHVFLTPTTLNEHYPFDPQEPTSGVQAAPDVLAAKESL